MTLVLNLLNSLETEHKTEEPGNDDRKPMKKVTYFNK